ncbi:MAG: hypothetical protein ACE5JI_16075, partial [Acidobacteriota bacterium]
FVHVELLTHVFQKYARLAKTASFLGVTGKLETEEGVVHVIAEALWRPAVRTQPAHGGSRDFH